MNISIDRKDLFFPKIPTPTTGPSNQKIGPETLGICLESEAREFENISEEGKSPSPRVMAGEEEIFEFPIQESNGEDKMKILILMNYLIFMEFLVLVCSYMQDI